MQNTPREVVKVNAGDTITNPQPGDFFLVHRHKIFSRLIQFGQGLRYTKEEAYWNHCGVFLDSNGTIAEALVRHGVTVGHIDKYKDDEYIVVGINAHPTDRAQMLDFAHWAEGKPYGFMTDVGLAFWCLFSGKFDFSIDGTLICSGFVARTLERAGYIFDRDPQREMPADLAHHFSVHRHLSEDAHPDQSATHQL